MNRISQGLKATFGAIGFSNLPKEKRYITFYSEGKNYWPHLENLLYVTLEQTNKSVCYVSSSLDDSSKLLGSSGWSMLSSIHLPLLKTSILTSVLLVMSDVVKELPATLILRPFNFETLAVSTYIYASEERMLQAAAPAIAIVLIGLIPIVFLSKMIRSSRPTH